MFKLNFKIANFEDKFSLSGLETYNQECEPRLCTVGTGHIGQLDTLSKPYVLLVFQSLD